MIEEFYNTTFSVTRRTVTSLTGETTAVTSGLLGLFRQVDDVSKLYISSNQGKEFDLVCSTSVDVREGDLITVGTIKYEVMGVGSYSDLEDGSDSHLDIRVVRK